VVIPALHDAAGDRPIRYTPAWAPHCLALARYRRLDGLTVKPWMVANLDRLYIFVLRDRR
jgi:hypothetical protein